MRRHTMCFRRNSQTSSGEPGSTFMTPASVRGGRQERISERLPDTTRRGSNFSGALPIQLPNRYFSSVATSLGNMDSRSVSSHFPGFSHIFELHDPCADRPFRASLDVTNELSLLRCEAKHETPIPGRWAMGGSKPGDVVWTTLAVPVLVSERVVSVLQEGGFSGWDVLPVELRDKSGDLLRSHYYLCVSGRSGAVDDARSVKFDKIMPGGAFPRWRGLYFDPTSWDGSDLFMPTGKVAWIFAVEAVKKAFDRAKVKNVQFTPLDEVERMKL